MVPSLPRNFSRGVILLPLGPTNAGVLRDVGIRDSLHIICNCLLSQQLPVVNGLRTEVVRI